MQTNLVWWCITITQSVWIAVFKVKVTVRVQILREYLSGWYLLNHLTFMNEAWYAGASSWPGVPCKKFGFLSSRSWSQCGLKSSRNNLLKFEPFATRFGIVMRHHELECCVTIFGLLCSRLWSQWGSNSMGIFVLTMSYEPLNLS